MVEVSAGRMLLSVQLLKPLETIGAGDAFLRIYYDDYYFNFKNEGLWGERGGPQETSFFFKMSEMFLQVRFCRLTQNLYIA